MNKLILIRVLLGVLAPHIAQAACFSARVERHMDGYKGCNVTFRVIDRTNSRTFDVKRFFSPNLVEMRTCQNFCRIYESNLAGVDKVHPPGEVGCFPTCNSSECKSNSPEESIVHLSSQLSEVAKKLNAGSTNDIPEFGVYKGVIDPTEGIGAFADIIRFGFAKKGNRNLDLGGGKFNQVSAFLSTLGIKNTVYDPFGRSETHNSSALEGVPYDTATSISVLNVIPDKEGRLDHIRRVHDSIKDLGIAYFKIYEGDRSGATSGFQNNRLTHTYVEEIESVFGKDNVEVKVFHNLIIAKRKNKSVYPTSK